MENCVMLFRNFRCKQPSWIINAHDRLGEDPTFAFELVIFTSQSRAEDKEFLAPDQVRIRRHETSWVDRLETKMNHLRMWRIGGIAPRCVFKECHVPLNERAKICDSDVQFLSEWIEVVKCVAYELEVPSHG